MEMSDMSVRYPVICSMCEKKSQEAFDSQQGLRTPHWAGLQGSEALGTVLELIMHLRSILGPRLIHAEELDKKSREVCHCEEGVWGSHC